MKHDTKTILFTYAQKKKVAMPVFSYEKTVDGLFSGSMNFENNTCDTDKAFTTKKRLEKFLCESYIDAHSDVLDVTNQKVERTHDITYATKYVEEQIKRWLLDIPKIRTYLCLGPQHGIFYPFIASLHSSLKNVVGLDINRYINAVIQVDKKNHLPIVEKINVMNNFQYQGGLETLGDAILRMCCFYDMDYRAVITTRGELTLMISNSGSNQNLTNSIKQSPLYQYLIIGNDKGIAKSEKMAANYVELLLGAVWLEAKDLEICNKFYKTINK